MHYVKKFYDVNCFIMKSYQLTYFFFTFKEDVTKLLEESSAKLQKSEDRQTPTEGLRDSRYTA